MLTFKLLSFGGFGFYQPIGYYLIGTALNDTIYGSAYDDTIEGLDGNDALYGNAGNDQLFGGNGHDYLSGGEGADILDAGAGNDSLLGGAGADALIGGAGFDTIRYTGSSAVRVDLAANTGTGGHAEGDTFSGIEQVIGSSYSDTIVGNAGANRFSGGAGHDQLFGGAGNDIMNGGAGQDLIDGGAGFDILVGGEGNDTFVLNRSGILGGAGDIIVDFVKGVDSLDTRGLGIRVIEDTSYNSRSHLSFSQGTQLPDLIRFERSTPGYYSPWANHLFFDTDDHKLLLLSPRSTPGSGGWTREFFVDEIARVAGADSLETQVSYYSTSPYLV